MIPEKKHVIRNKAKEKYMISLLKSIKCYMETLKALAGYTLFMDWKT